MNSYHLESGSENFNNDLLCFMNGGRLKWQHPAIPVLLKDLRGSAIPKGGGVTVWTSSGARLLALLLQSLLRHHDLDAVFRLDAEEGKVFVNRWGIMKSSADPCDDRAMIREINKSVPLRDPRFRKGLLEKVFGTALGSAFVKDALKDSRHENICLVEFDGLDEKWRLMEGDSLKGGFGPFRRRMIQLPSSSMADALEIMVGICDSEPSFTSRAFRIARNFRKKHERKSDELLFLAGRIFLQ